MPGSKAEPKPNAKAADKAVSKQTMQTDALLQPAQKTAAVEPRSTEGETRRQIMLLLLKQSPLSASDIGEQLGLSAAGVRRHLDSLVHQGFAEITRPRTAAKGRGRPAKSFRLTHAGRNQFGHDYDSLAALALESLRETGGEDAVYAFARKRMHKILQDFHVGSDEAPRDIASRLAEVLSNNGYAAEVQATERGLQICQHHCPIANVASEFPELCQAEHEVLAEVFGQHIQPLASIAGGHDLCITNIPLTVFSNPQQAADQSPKHQCCGKSEQHSGRALGSERELGVDSA